MTWSDWGTPDRVIDSLRREGIRPDWLRELAPTAQAQPIPAKSRCTSSVRHSSVPGRITEAAAAATP